MRKKKEKEKNQKHLPVEGATFIHDPSHDVFYIVQFSIMELLGLSPSVESAYLTRYWHSDWPLCGKDT